MGVIYCFLLSDNIGELKNTISIRETMKVDDISAWEAFQNVAKHGSFSAAARFLKVPTPQISKRIARLESQLGIRLFQRTTRVVSLTDEGKSLLPKIESILEDLHEAENLFESRKKISGSVKVTCVPFIAHRLLLPVLGDFFEKNPHIHVVLELSESFRNLVQEGYDMAIRIETPKDSDLIYRRLAPNDLIFCASPAYLERNSKELQSPIDLMNHDLLSLSIHNRARFIAKDYTLGDFSSSKKITCEDGVFLTDMALKGMGVLVRSILDVQDHLEKGHLVEVLEDYRLETFGYLHAVIPSKRFLAPRVRSFLDFVLQQSQHWKKR